MPRPSLTRRLIDGSPVGAGCRPLRRSPRSERWLTTRRSTSTCCSRASRRLRWIQVGEVGANLVSRRPRRRKPAITSFGRPSGPVSPGRRDALTHTVRPVVDVLVERRLDAWADHFPAHRPRLAAPIAARTGLHLTTVYTLFAADALPC